MDEMPQPKRGYLSKKQTEFIINDIDQYQVPLSTTKYNIELFKGYKNIIIVGNPRSGTTFTGHALAKSLSLNYVDENSYGLRNVDLFSKNKILCFLHIFLPFIISSLQDLSSILINSNPSLFIFFNTSPSNIS